MKRIFTACLSLFALSLACRAATTGETVVATYEATWSQDPGTKCADDPDALDGKALYLPASDEVYYRWYSLTANFPVLAGDYEVRFRMKVDDNSAEKPIFQADDYRTTITVKCSDFKTARTYQEFTLPHSTPPGQWKSTINCRLRRMVGPATWVDRLTVVCKHRLTEAETLAAGGFERIADPKPVAHDGLRVWFVKGLYYEHYRILEALTAMNAKIDLAWTPRPPGGLDGLSIDGQRKALTGDAAIAKEKADALVEARKAEHALDDKMIDMLDSDEVAGVDLESQEDKAARQSAQERQTRYAHAMSYDLIVLCNVEAENLSLPQRALIQDAVKAGASLLLIGGPFAFGRGLWNESEILSDLLPLTPTGERDLQPLAAFTPLTARTDGLLAKLVGGDSPAVCWVHRGTPKPGVTIELSAGDTPVLLTREYGRGHIALLAGTVLGEPAAGQVAFWDWPRWPEVMKTVVQQLLPEAKRSASSDR